MSPTTKNVLVTGGAGYIGSHTAKALASAGFVPVVYDNLVHGHRTSVRWGPFEEGDIGDSARLTAVLARHDIAAVMHFAAFAYVGESVTQPERYFDNNVAKSFVLLDTVRKAGIRHIVFSSSCATYGSPRRLPIAEDTPQHPINPYGETKLMVERALYWYGIAHGLSSVALRYFNAAGADPDGEIGENHSPETHVIPLVIDAALGRRIFEIYGADYPTRDGTCVRDYVHVSDLAVAHVQALRYLMAGGETTALNLGTGEGFTVREIIEMVQLVSARPVPHSIAPRRAGDPAVLVADPNRAMSLLDWKPTYSDLKSIVQTAWNWHTAGTNFFPDATDTGA
jgi:UDP-arabinose 4-epimerase